MVLQYMQLHNLYIVRIDVWKLFISTFFKIVFFSKIAYFFPKVEFNVL